MRVGDSGSSIIADSGALIGGDAAGAHMADGAIGHGSATDCPTCDDGIDCTTDSCADGICSHALAAGKCSETQSCLPSGGGCVNTPSCSANADCADDDPCTTNERCNKAMVVCQYDILDHDTDKHAPASCGGDDPDDADASRFPGAPDVCDGIDNDGDGSTDEEPDSKTSCSGYACEQGKCRGLCAAYDAVFLSRDYPTVVTSCGAYQSDQAMWDKCLNEQFKVVSNGAISSGCIGCLVPLVDCLRLCNDGISTLCSNSSGSCACNFTQCGQGCADDFAKCSDRALTCD